MIAAEVSENKPGYTGGYPDKLRFICFLIKLEALRYVVYKAVISAAGGYRRRGGAGICGLFGKIDLQPLFPALLKIFDIKQARTIIKEKPAFFIDKTR